jgi:hypothetical protein
MNNLTREKCITEVFLGNNYTYISEAEENNQESKTLIKKIQRTDKDSLSNYSNNFTVIKTNRPAQYKLFRTIFTFYGTEKSNFAHGVYDKFVNGDTSYIDDLEPLIEKQLEEKGLKIIISSDPLCFYHKKITLDGLDLNEWLSDIKTELDKYKNLEFQILKSPEKYFFPTNIK